MLLVLRSVVCFERHIVDDLYIDDLFFCIRVRGYQFFAEQFVQNELLSSHRVSTTAHQVNQVLPRLLSLRGRLSRRKRFSCRQLGWVQVFNLQHLQPHGLARVG